MTFIGSIIKKCCHCNNRRLPVDIEKWLLKIGISSHVVKLLYDKYAFTLLLCENDA